MKTEAELRKTGIRREAGNVFIAPQGVVTLIRPIHGEPDGEVGGAVSFRRKEPALGADQPEQSPRHCSQPEVPHSLSGAPSVVFQAKVTVSGLEYAASLGLACG